MDTFALRSMRRQYEPKDIASQGEGIKPSSNLQTSQGGTSPIGCLETHSLQSLHERGQRRPVISRPFASPTSTGEVFLEGRGIEEVAPREERAARNLAASGSRATSSTASSFTDLDQLRRGSYEGSMDALLPRIGLAISKIYDYCDFYFNDPLDIPQKERADPLNQEFGFTGLSNQHGTCYLNAALQFSAEVVRTIEREGSSTEKQMLNQNLERVPHFRQFVDGSLKTKEGQRALYREVSCEVSKSFWFGDGGPSMNQLQTGFKRSGKSSLYIEHFLTQLQTPQLSFSRRSEAEERCYQVRILLDGQLDEFTQLQDPASSIKLTGEIPACFIRKCTFEQEKEGPVGKIQFFHQDSNGEITAITFEPKAVLISTRTPNHSFCCLHKNGTWYEINDNFIKEIPKKWEGDLLHFMAENGETILYEKQTSPAPKKELNARQNSPEKATENKVIDQGEERQPKLDPSSIAQQWKNFAQGMSKKSFYYHRRYQQLLKLEGEEAAPSLLTLRERNAEIRDHQEELERIHKIKQKA